ncbi:MAG: hypothetical protein ABW104_10495 [Candidatus Thiodiazotropha sp. 6PLUC2]
MHKSSNYAYSTLQKYLRQILVRVISVVIGVLTSGSVALCGPAIGQFEVKHLSATPGEIEFQSQNAHMFGNPERDLRNDSGEIQYDDNSVTKQRHALELEFGITNRLKSRIGIEYEKERLDEPDTPEQADEFSGLELSEIGAEVIWVVDPIKENDFGFGLVAEYEQPLEDEEASLLLVGSIFQVDRGEWSSIINLYLVKHLGGDEPQDEKVDFAYATQVGYSLNRDWQIALEAYGTVDRIGNTGSMGEEAQLFGDHDQHRIGPVFYYSGGLGADSSEEESSVSVGVGLLVGLNGNTPDTTLKWSIEVEF